MDIEKEIEKLKLEAPRVTPEDVDNFITHADYHVFERTCLTVCCLTLKNNFTVVGHSACASPENFNAELGRKLAFDKARQQVFAFLGFELCSKLKLQETL